MKFFDWFCVSFLLVAVVLAFFCYPEEKEEAYWTDRGMAWIHIPLDKIPENATITNTTLQINCVQSDWVKQEVEHQRLGGNSLWITNFSFKDDYIHEPQSYVKEKIKIKVCRTDNYGNDLKKCD